MKKRVIAMAVALVGICAATTISVKDAQASENASLNVCARDTHCTKCGTHNGRWRCRSFRPVKGRPTDCQCGHEKKNHIGC